MGPLNKVDCAQLLCKKTCLVCLQKLTTEIFDACLFKKTKIKKNFPVRAALITVEQSLTLLTGSVTEVGALNNTKFKVKY